MTKAELARMAGSAHGVDSRTAVKVISSFLELIVKTTASGMPVQLHGFGTFTLSDMPGRGRTPVPAARRGTRRSPEFKASKAYRQRIR